jgi:hypothetical protein
MNPSVDVKTLILEFMKSKAKPLSSLDNPWKRRGPFGGHP